MFFVLGKDYSEPSVLLRHPSVVREELRDLENTLKEGDATLARLREKRRELEALRALTDKAVLWEMAEKLETAERAYLETLDAIEAREDELASVLRALRRGMRS